MDREHLADLVEAIAGSGDREAFASLFQYFAPRVKAYLLRLGAQDGMAEELMQETMLTIWRRAATFDRSRSSVSTWLFTIARNRRIDMLRKERRPEFDPNDPALVPAESVTQDDHVEAQQRDERLRAAVETLPAEQAELIQQAFFADKSHREIAAESGLPLGTVKSRIRLALARLRAAVDDGE